MGLGCVRRGRACDPCSGLDRGGHLAGDKGEARQRYEVQRGG